MAQAVRVRVPLPAFFCCKNPNGTKGVRGKGSVPPSLLWGENYIRKGGESPPPEIKHGGSNPPPGTALFFEKDLKPHGLKRGSGERERPPEIALSLTHISSPLRGEGAGAKNNEHRIAQRASW